MFFMQVVPIHFVSISLLHLLQCYKPKCTSVHNRPGQRYNFSERKLCLNSPCFILVTYSKYEFQHFSSVQIPTDRYVRGRLSCFYLRSFTLKLFLYNVHSLPKKLSLVFNVGFYYLQYAKVDFYIAL